MPYITLPEPKYPLTGSEKKWLEEREETEQTNGYYFCAHSEIQSAEWNTKTGWGDVYWVIEAKDAYKDAAEFEARVAAKMAKREHPVPCYSGKCCHPIPYAQLCPACSLKHARLAVEAEMNI